MPKSTTSKQRRLAKRQVEYPQRVIQWWKDTMRQRIERSVELMENAPRVFRGDLHVHSTYSDGVGTVDEVKSYADSAGLDFIFVTDHGGINQKRSCVKYPNVWWGQEPGTQYHHLGILGLDRKYKTKRDLVYDFNRVKALGGFPFIPHPTGWFPTTRYSEEQKEALHLLGDEFAIEVINGANQIFDCFDVTDAMTIELWDQHLCQGKRVTGLGCTDAHLPQAMGDVWTGVFCDQLEKDAVIEAVRKGHCFASDAPLIWLNVNGGMMGDVVRTGPADLKVAFECADSLGLSMVRILRDGEIIEESEIDGEPRVSGTIRDPFQGGNSYYRLECLSVDQRRAYSNPVYLWE